MRYGRRTPRPLLIAAIALAFVVVYVAYFAILIRLAKALATAAF